MFHQHIDHYSDKAISMVRCIKLLGNSVQGINPIQKCLLYRCCVLPITLYSSQLWFYNKALLSYHMKILGKVQRRAAIWILGAFKTSPSEGIKAIVGIISIKFHLQKLTNRSQLHSVALLVSYLIRTLMDDPSNSHFKPIPHSINTLTNCQKTIVKGHLIDSNNKLFGVFPLFSPLHLEFNPGSRIVDKFSDRFSFNLSNREEKDKIHF